MNRSRIALGLLVLAIAFAATWMLARSAQAMTFADVSAAMRGTSVSRILAAALATALSFAGLSYYDRFATEVVAPGCVPRGQALFAGGVAHAISNTLGFHAVTGSALRYRLYRQAGLGAVDIARVTALVGACVAIGSVTLLVTALAFAPDALSWGRSIGVVGLLAVLALLACFPAVVRWLRLRTRALPVLDRRALLRPMSVGLVEAGAAIFAVFVLLPPDLAPPFAKLAAIVLAATLLGVLSHAPGGLGVFEAAVLAAFPAGRHADVLAALLLFRLLYNLLPFTIAVVLLTVQQARSGTGASVRRRV